MLNAKKVMKKINEAVESSTIKSDEQSFFFGSKEERDAVIKGMEREGYVTPTRITYMKKFGFSFAPEVSKEEAVSVMKSFGWKIDATSSNTYRCYKGSTPPPRFYGM